MNLTAFRLMLPEDGSHQAIVQRARDAGLPFKLVDGDTVVRIAAKRDDDHPALGYQVDFPDIDAMGRIAQRLCVCTELAAEGLGVVPTKAPEGQQTDREKLERLRDVFRTTSDAIEGLLEATR